MLDRFTGILTGTLIDARESLAGPAASADCASEQLPHVKVYRVRAPLHYKCQSRYNQPPPQTIDNDSLAGYIKQTAISIRTT